MRYCIKKQLVAMPDWNTKVLGTIFFFFCRSNSSNKGVKLEGNLKLQRICVSTSNPANTRVKARCYVWPSSVMHCEHELFKWLRGKPALDFVSVLSGQAHCISPPSKFSDVNTIYLCINTYIECHKKNYIQTPSPTSFRINTTFFGFSEKIQNVYLKTK